MKLAFTSDRKLCWAKPGDLVVLPCATTGGEATYLVCIAGKSLATVAGLASKGLYAEDQPLLMVNLVTGEAKALPNLSSKVKVIPGEMAEVHLRGVDG